MNKTILHFYNIDNNEKNNFIEQYFIISRRWFFVFELVTSNYVYYEYIGFIDGYGEVPQIYETSSDGNSTSEQITNVFKFLLAPISNSSSQENVAISEIDEDNYSSRITHF